MKYVAPKAELVSLEVNSVILLSDLFCIIYDPENPDCEDKLPDFYE
ncbi:MAG: hypothetical protein IJA60_07455 [Clostridia bacterium]|nr:hypothetical protein [Clostridia bacterium]